MQKLKILASAVPEISLGAEEFKMSHLTLTTLLSRVTCTPCAGTWQTSASIHTLIALASAVPNIWLVPSKI